ncbi:hypothetical protein [Pectobacterium carotovorum]|uniref:hypothetical protein n=1 Tax=Pectobacterium carotovorum TaxID=554 RepID=UPI0021F282EF|nr:hypothetical protein [Pectobacterium carotovorum]
MTDDNDLSQESLEIGYTIAEPFSDHVLLTYIKWANYGLNMGITISVKGIVYTGKIISGAEWCEKRIQDLEIS